MESVEESQHGYPEEAPPGSNPNRDDPPSEETPQRSGGKAVPRRAERDAESGDGKATGNPRSAG
jgi:hypothetical protein